MLFCFLLFLAEQPYITKLLHFIQTHAIEELSEFWLGCAVVTASTSILVYLHKKTIRNDLYIQHKYLALATFWFLFYLYYRCIDDTFVFWGWVHENHCYLAYTDTLFILYVFLLAKRIAYERKDCKVLTENTMILDVPIEDAADDFFGYNNMARALLSDLRATDVSKKGFSVGITGQWGIGKSSFLNLFEKQVKDSRDIVVRFYPRSSVDYKQISADFFASLSVELRKYHTGVNKLIGKYVRSLRLLDGDGWIGRSLDTLDYLLDEDDKSLIEATIEEIGRKIFIIIEDLDRLTAKEILEVLKITDRNGNFKNTYFITAYDKKYINSVLRHYLGYDENQIFTDKYFNYEYTLPAHSIFTERQYVRQYLFKHVGFVDQDAINQSELLSAWDSLSSEVIRALGVLRNVKRFLNILMSRYPGASAKPCV